MNCRAPGNRAMTSVLANVLLVAIAIVLAVTITVFGFSFAENVPDATAEASVDFEPAPVGLEVTPRALGTDVDVLLNGERVTGFAANESGVTRLVPTSPGDRVTVVSRGEESSVLVTEEIDERSEAGDFVAHYRFDSGSGTTLVDRSGNGNDGTIQGSPAWVADGFGSALEFTGSNDHVDVTDLGVDAMSVDEFTVAVAYRQDGSTDRVNQLVEHHSGGNEWFLETEGGSTSGTYDLDYAVNYPSDQLSTSQGYATGTTHVAVATYDGSKYELFVDGQGAGTGSYASSVDMGDLVIGADAPGGSSQYFDGRIYEIRLYYQAFDEESVTTVTDAMD